MTSPAQTSGNTYAPLAIRAWLRYDVVARQFKRLRPKTVLEFGCGMGAVGSRLAVNHKYVGVEPDPGSRAVAAARIEPHDGLILESIAEGDLDRDTFDLVCAFEVLEHIEDDRSALKYWCSFLEPGGHLMLSVPAFQRRFGSMDVHAGHFRRYEPAALRELLEEAGLGDVEITVYAWPLGYALESVRNRIDAKKLAAHPGASLEQLTAASGRTFQPSNRLTGEAIRLVTIPFRYAQRLRPGAGTGLLAVARKL